MFLGVRCIFKRAHKNIRVTLSFADVMPWACEFRILQRFELPICLGMVRSSYKILQSENAHEVMKNLFTNWIGCPSSNVWVYSMGQSNYWGANLKHLIHCNVSIALFTCECRCVITILRTFPKFLPRSGPILSIVIQSSTSDFIKAANVDYVSETQNYARRLHNFLPRIDVARNKRPEEIISRHVIHAPLTWVSINLLIVHSI